jgi:hypothetical protein
MVVSLSFFFLSNLFFRRHDSKHDDIQQNDTLRYDFHHYTSLYDSKLR